MLNTTSTVVKYALMSAKYFDHDTDLLSEYSQLPQRSTIEFQTSQSNNELINNAYNNPILAYNIVPLNQGHSSTGIP